MEISSLLRHRVVTVIVGALRLQRFQPVPDGAACLIDRGGDDHGPLAAARDDLDDAGPETRDLRLEPGPEHQRPYIPAARGGAGRGRNTTDFRCLGCSGCSWPRVLCLFLSPFPRWRR